MNIRHRNGAYPVVFGPLEDALESLPRGARFITDETVLSVLPRALPSEQTFVVSPGEGSKDFATYQRAVVWLAERGARRGETFVAVGGGVVGDLGGFVAATYMRGIPFVQIPTSLLAMVDSSVGGKVGIDLAHGKNLVGAFKPPQAVYICEEVLATLPPRHFFNGMSEVIKMAFVLDAPLAHSLREEPIRPGDSRLSRVIQAGISLKASVVERDEYETTGLRAVLNFGHTVAHAIEHALEYRDWLHGEAVAVGMVIETDLAERLGCAPPGTRALLEATLRAHDLPTTPPRGLSVDGLMASMARDKKAAQGLALSLPFGLGACKLVQAVDPVRVRETLDEWLNR